MVGLFQRTKFKVNGMLSIILEPGSEMERFYEAIAAGAVKSDDDAKAHFPEYDQNPGRLHTIKGKLKDRLNDSILLLDFRESAFTERQHAFYACSKKWATAMTLLSKNARENGINLLENLLRQALRFEFTELTVDILRTLRLHYGILEGDQKRYDQIEQQINQFEEYWIMERKTEGFYAELVTRYVRNKSQKEEISNKAQTYFHQVKPYMERCETFKVQFFGRMLEILIYDSVQDYSNTARLCEEALAYFAKKDYVSSIVLQVFNYNLFTCYLHLRAYDKCLQLADKHQGLFEDGSYNWFKLQELYFLTAMQSGNLAEALRIHEIVSAHPNLEHQPTAITELWKIFEAYTCLLLQAGLIIGKHDSAQKFKLSKFMNEVSMFSKDKAGMNLPILIVQHLFDVVSGRWAQIIDRAEALAKYRTRYVSGPELVRTNCFLRMLEQLPKCSFKLEEVQKRTAPLFSALLEMPSPSPQNLEIEVVPYELLWDVALRSLGKSADQSKATPGLSLQVAPATVRYAHSA